MEWRIRKSGHGGYVAEYGARHEGGMSIDGMNGYTMPAFIARESARFDTMREAEAYIAEREREEENEEATMDINEFQHIISGSKQFSFSGYSLKVLEITNYRTGERVKIDLGRLTQEMLDELLVDDEDREEDYED